MKIVRETTYGRQVTLHASSPEELISEEEMKISSALGCEVTKDGSNVNVSFPHKWIAEKFAEIHERRLNL